MTPALVPLSMATIGSIAAPCRSCVFWELDADAAGLAQREGHTAFEKEVWLSGVMLTWGSAGLILTDDDEPIGHALFAPPPTVPAAATFPTAPVSADAVLLTTVHIAPTHRRRGFGRFLLDGVIGALTGRGVRAIEAFGNESGHGRARPPSARHCTVPAGFLRSAGFVDVAAHRRYPRLRLELSGVHLWKAEVEAALDRLVDAPTVGSADLVASPA